MDAARTRHSEAASVLLGAVVSIFTLLQVHPFLALPGYRGAVGVLFGAYLIVWTLFSIAMRGRISLGAGVGFWIGCAFTGVIVLPTFPLILETLVPRLGGWVSLVWLSGVAVIVAVTWATRWIAKRLVPARLSAAANSRPGRWVVVVFQLGAIVLVIGSLSDRLVNHPLPDPNRSAQPTTRDHPFRVVLLGIDGADWRIIEELSAEGALPNLSRVRTEGASGLLDTIAGPSPLVWTSIATGRRPEHHGIADLFEFFEQRSEIRIPNMIFNPFVPLQEWTMIRRRIPYTAWEAKPLWTVHSEQGGANLIFNWWFTLPALPVLGILVSDPMLDYSYLDCGRDTAMAQIPHAYYPSDLRLSGFNRACTMLGEATGQRNELNALQLLNENRTDIARARAMIGQGDIVGSLQTTQRIGFEVFDSLLASDPFAFATFVDTSVDMASHHFSLRVFSRGRKDGKHEQIVSDADRAKYRAPVATAYRDVDAALGRVLERADDRTVVLVVSDHGWNYDGTEHSGDDPGIVALWGGPIRKGFNLEGRSIYDIAPTVLRLLGLPLSAELEGTPITEALRVETLAELGDPRTVRTYGPPDPSDALELSSDENSDYMERLRSLGYVK